MRLCVRRLRLALVLWMVLVGGFAAAGDDGLGPDVRAAIDELERLRQEVAAATAKGDARYESEAAMKNLVAAGLPQYMTAYGIALTTTWQGAKKHGLAGGPLLGVVTVDGSLVDSIDYLKETKAVDPEDMEGIRTQMEDWRKRRERLFDLLEQLLVNLAESGKHALEYSASAPADERRRHARRTLDLGDAEEKLYADIKALFEPPPVQSFRQPPFAARAERKEGLLMGLALIEEGLGLPKIDADAVSWQRIRAGGTFHLMDSARLTAIPGRRKLPPNPQVHWFARTEPDGPWKPFAEGQPAAFRVPEREGKIWLRGEMLVGGKVLRTDVIDFTIAALKCQAFYSLVLADFATGARLYREAKATTKTYETLWKEQPSLPQVYDFEIDRATQRPYEPEDGDVVLRTAGFMSYVQLNMGHPGSVANHSGVVEVIAAPGGRRLHVIHEIEWGHKIEALTPSDVALAKEIGYAPKAMSTPDVCFLAGANVGSALVYRPVGTTTEVAGEAGQTKEVRYPTLGKEVAARAVAVGARVKPGYDLLFLESSVLADQKQFQDLYYCHEYTRECFGRSLAKPVELPFLRRFWEAAWPCDAEAAANRATGRPWWDPAALADRLGEIDLDSSLSLSLTPEAKDQLHELIVVMRKVLTGTSYREVLTLKVAEGVHEMWEKKVAELTKSSFLLTPLFRAYFWPTVSSWIAWGEYKVAQIAVEGSFFSKGLLEDLCDALDTSSILQGGDIQGAGGETVHVRFIPITKSP